MSEIRKGKMSEYEKQRLSRIAENKARFEALGIFKSAKALLGTSPSSRGRRSSGEEDDDYTPDEADSDEEDDFVGDSTKAVSSKSKASASKTKVFSNKNLTTSDEDSDDDLTKAIALSLHHSGARGSASTPTKKKRNDEEAARGKKKKTEPMSRTQMTEDELLIYFDHFDESGKGFITMRDVAKMAMLHDFTWTDEELQDMIRCFDMDKDGKLSLDEFKKIATRCRMLKES